MKKKKMNPFIAALLGFSVLAVGAAAYFVVKKKFSVNKLFHYAFSKLEVVNVSRPTTPLGQKDMIAWFQELNLNPDRHTPFVARVSAVRDFCVLPLCDEANSIFLGVYDETNDAIVHHCLIIAPSLSQEVLNMLGTESLVVLQ